MEFTLSDESEKSKKKELNSAELTKQLDKLIQDQADNQRIFDWVEVGIPACVYFPVLFYFHLHFLLVLFMVFPLKLAYNATSVMCMSSMTFYLKLRINNISQSHLRLLLKVRTSRDIAVSINLRQNWIKNLL